MKQLEIAPKIYEYETFEQFASDFSLSEKDLILTNSYIYHPTIAKTGVPCRAVFQEEYGGGEPSDTMVNGILAEMYKAETDRIIAVGGGTVIDIAKILSVADGEADVNELYDKMDSLKSRHELFIVPTTCGTGSEVTNISIVNRTVLKTKQGLVSDAMYASCAILIPEFIQTLPYSVFATSSIDALIHAVESYLSPFCTPYTEMFSVAAIRDIVSGYKSIAENGVDFKTIGSVFLRASNYAGIAFGLAGCGAVHALSYALGGGYHVAHGESNYQFFLPILRLYKTRLPDGKLFELNSLLGELLGDDDGIEALGVLLEKILPHKPMSAYGATQADIAPFTESTVANQQRLLGKAYVPLSDDEIYSIFQSCLDD